MKQCAAPQSVTFTLSRYSYDNFIVCDSDERIVYWVENKHEHILSANPIRVYCPGPMGEKEFIAKLELHRIGGSLLTYQGKRTYLESHFPRKDWPSA